MEADKSFTEQVIQVLIVPLNGQNLVVPQTMIIEVIPIPVPEAGAITKEGEWLRSKIEWRGKGVPLVSIETLCGSGSGEFNNRTRRAAIIQGVSQRDAFEFYAIEIYSIPHPVRITNEDIEPADESVDCDLYLQSVKASGVLGHILDFDLLEEKIQQKISANIEKTD